MPSWLAPILRLRLRVQRPFTNTSTFNVQRSTSSLGFYGFQASKRIPPPFYVNCSRMKRASQALVSYSTSDDESDDQKDDSVPSLPPPKKRKKLPPVSSTVVVPTPIDNPALHQGRIRSTPHVEGQFPVHVYVSLQLGRNSSLYKVIQAIVCDAKDSIPALHEIWSPEHATQRRELHISLSRPIFLRAHQREDLKRAVKNVARMHKAFVVSFATLSELINDEKTRTFLTIEIGAGHHELCSLTDALSPALEAIRQQTYYVKPRFHASIAWALLKRPNETDSQINSSDESPGPCLTPDRTSISRNNSSTEDVFSALDRLSPEVIKTLNDRYGTELSSPKVGAFEAQAITVKIGKEVLSWSLTG